MIRLANNNDAEDIIEIYRYYVENTPITFESHVPSLDQMRQRITRPNSTYPWLVYQQNSKVLAYCYASSFKARSAYDWTVEVSIYLDKGKFGMGIATDLYNKLFFILKKQGYYSAIACISKPSNRSEGFHKKMGFELIGQANDVGFKLGKWHSISWWQKILQPMNEKPSSPKKVVDIKGEIDFLT